MSYTEIYRVTKSGKTKCIGEVRNAWRGAMAIWNSLERAYLPSLPRPLWMTPEEYAKDGYWRTGVPSIGSKEDPMKPIWELHKDIRLTESECICLLSTFDNVLVMKDDLPKVVSAFREFPYETSLKEQAEIIENSMNDRHLFAVCWNQTSVNADIPGDKITDNYWDLFKALNSHNPAEDYDPKTKEI